MLRMKISKGKSASFQDWTGANRDGAREHGTVIDKRVEFTFFSAGVGAHRKVAEKAVIEFATSEAAVQFLKVDTRDSSSDAGANHFVRQISGVQAPYWKERLKPDGAQLTFSIGTNVFKKEIAKYNPLDALFFRKIEYPHHLGFVSLVRAWIG